MENTTRNMLKIVVPVLVIGVVVASERQYKKEQQRLIERRELIRQNLRWMGAHAYTMPYDEFVKEYNERIEFMNIVSRLR